MLHWWNVPLHYRYPSHDTNAPLKKSWVLLTLYSVWISMNNWADANERVSCYKRLQKLRSLPLGIQAWCVNNVAVLIKRAGRHWREPSWATKAKSIFCLINNLCLRLKWLIHTEYCEKIFVTSVSLAHSPTLFFYISVPFSVVHLCLYFLSFSSLVIYLTCP